MPGVVVAGILADDSDLSRAEKRAALLARQGGACAICRASARSVADHDHGTGLLRGLLCRACNMREGQHRSGLVGVDDPAIAAYLADPPAAGLGWMWDLPDWWGPASTLEASALGVTVAAYAAARRPDPEAADRAAAALAATDLPALLA